MLEAENECMENQEAFWHQNRPFHFLDKGLGRPRVLLSIILSQHGNPPDRVTSFILSGLSY